jgi:tRNA(His) 5'-end guanylyltransferase
MKFDDLDAKMRIFETAHDHCVLPEIFIVARLDGRGFTKLTKEVHKFEAPFDERFRDLMVHAVEHLMSCGFQIVYGYTQSDEISLLFAREDASFGRKERKLNSILAGEASVAFSLALGAPASFDCRICQLPTRELVRDYFRWRSEDAHRNALNAHCYWLQRKQGVGVAKATDKLKGMSVADMCSRSWTAGNVDAARLGADAGTAATPRRASRTTPGHRQIERNATLGMRA